MIIKSLSKKSTVLLMVLVSLVIVAIGIITYILSTQKQILRSKAGDSTTFPCCARDGKLGATCHDWESCEAGNDYCASGYSCCAKDNNGCSSGSDCCSGKCCGDKVCRSSCDGIGSITCGVGKDGAWIKNGTSSKITVNISEASYCWSSRATESECKENSMCNDPNPYSGAVPIEPGADWRQGGSSENCGAWQAHFHSDLCSVPDQHGCDWDTKICSVTPTIPLTIPPTVPPTIPPTIPPTVSPTIPPTTPPTITGTTTISPTITTTVSPTVSPTSRFSPTPTECVVVKPDVPKFTDTEIVQGDKCKLAWEKVPNITGYAISWGKIPKAEGETEVKVSASTTSYIFNCPDVGKTSYYFKIKALNDCAESENSAIFRLGYQSPGSPTNTQPPTATKALAKGQSPSVTPAMPDAGSIPYFLILIPVAVILLSLIF